MRRFVLLILPLLLLLWAAPAQAIHVEPGAPTVNCGQLATVAVPYGDESVTDHVGIDIRRKIKPNDAAVYDAPVPVAQIRDLGLQKHAHAWFEKMPQADAVIYEAAFVNAAGQYSLWSAGGECNTDLGWIAGAEFEPTFSTSTISGEWADASEADPSRTDRVSFLKLKGSYGYRCFLQEGDNPGGFGERCEYEQGNADASNQERKEKLYQLNDELWQTFAVQIPQFGFAFCPAGGCSGHQYEGGSIEQTKQKGGCGTPAMTIASWNDPADGGPTLREMVSDTGGCESNSMDQVWKLPIGFNQWAKILRHIKFNDLDSTGYVETWADTDGNSSTTWTPVPASGTACASGCEYSVTTEAGPPEIGGTVQRVHTHTMKNNTSDGPYPSTLCNDPDRCSHQRVGVYRGGNVGQISGDSTIYHDSVAAGPTLSTVLNAAY